MVTTLVTVAWAVLVFVPVALIAIGLAVFFLRDHDDDRPAHVEGGGLNGGAGPRPAVRQVMDRNGRR
jgi:uncharacterized membrane protein